MKIPKEKRELWAELYQSGDVSKLSELTGLSRPTIYAILGRADVTPLTLKKINAFYDARAKEEKETYQEID